MVARNGIGCVVGNGMLLGFGVSSPGCSVMWVHCCGVFV